MVMGKQNNKIVLVTGGTGKQGGAVARHLTGKGFTVQVLTRKPDSNVAKALRALGIEIVQGDLNDSASLERALRGVWGVFAVQTFVEDGIAGEEEQGKRLARLAREKGVQHYVYSSVGSAHRKTGIPHFENKWRIEETIRSLNFTSHVILRPVFFMENLIAPWVAQGDKIAMAVKPETIMQMIAVDDIGEFGALAFERAADLNRDEIDIAGDALTMPQAAVVMGKALGRRIEFVSMPIEEARKQSQDFAIMFEWFNRVGYNVDIPNLEKKYGIKLMKLADWAKTHVLV